MGLTDEAFREEFKPLYVPAHYAPDDSDENKVVYALAQLGEGSSDDVAAKLLNLDKSIDIVKFKAIAASILTSLYDKGLISGTEETGAKKSYNLNKITQANQGAVNPNLLAPGLD